jgi:hypothetical protein
VSTFAAVTGGCALAVAAWHWRNRGQPEQKQPTGQTRQEQERSGQLTRSSR